MVGVYPAYQLRYLELLAHLPAGKLGPWAASGHDRAVKSPEGKGRLKEILDGWKSTGNLRLRQVVERYRRHARETIVGTSTPFGGGMNSNPLLPSWLNSPPGTPGSSPAQKPGVPVPATPPSNPAPPPPPEKRYTPGRKAFDKGARSSSHEDRERSFRKAAASYVSRASGGAAGASRRASSDKVAAGRLAGILLRAGADGSDIRQELRRLNLNTLAQRSIPEIFDALVDYICEPGGDLDQAYARDAYTEAVAAIPAEQMAQLDRPDLATIGLVLEHFITNTIMNRLLNAVGAGAITLPATASSAENLNDMFRDWIRGRVQDAMEAANGILREGQVATQIDKIYYAAYSILEAPADEGDQ